MLCFCAFVQPVFAQEVIEADRPGYADGTTTVPFKHVQIELGVDLGLPTFSVDGPGVLLRGGIAENIELRLGVPSISAGYSSVSGPIFAASGRWYVGSKFAFVAGPAELSLVPAVAIPVLTNLKPAGTLNASLGFNWAVDLNDVLGVSGNVLGTLSPIGDVTGSLSGSVAMGVGIDRFGFYGEGIVLGDPNGFSAGVGAGITANTDTRTQYDLSVTSGLVGTSLGTTIGIGYAYRW